MGIDVYLRWDGMTKEEEKAQITGFDTTAGKVGYLREAYHGSPYATRVLFHECWEGEENEREYPADVLRGRLPQAIEVAKERARRVYGERVTSRSRAVKSFADFVALAERKERETGKPCRVLVSY